MSNRYVWGRYAVEPVFATDVKVVTISQLFQEWQGTIKLVQTTDPDVLLPDDSTSWPQNAYFPASFAGSAEPVSVGFKNIPANTYFSVFADTDIIGSKIRRDVYYTARGCRIETTYVDDYSPHWYDVGIMGVRSDATGVGFNGSKGTPAGTVSNSSASTYPQDGISGNYWYTYQGSDSIDAAAVGYSNQSPMGGQPITINVTPRTPTYGGTIRYTYQVQLSGGAWTTIATNVTATSRQYTIPAGTTSFAARVRASDTWGFSSSDYTTGATLSVTNNLPPSAPDGITIGDVLGGQQCTITWGAATDSDGTIDHYELERQVDNGDTWTQIFSGNALTYSDTINSEWATVNYRVRAVDDDAEPGPYTTGTMKTVNAGWLYFSGPAADMGDKPAPFDFVFSIGSTTPDVTDISVEVLLDDEIIYTGTPDAAEQVSVHIDTRLMFAGEHVLVITAEKQNLLGLNQECTFTVPAVTLPDGGRMVQLYNDEGQPVFPLTLGRAVIGTGGEDVNEILDRVFSGTYTGTGTSGSRNPCQLRLSFVPRFLFVYSNAPASGWWVRTADATTSAQGTMETTGGTATVTWDNDNMVLSWYASSAAVQLNTSGTVYGYLVIG